MLLTLKIKLAPNSEQQKNLLETMKRFNEACNYISRYAFDNKTNSVIKIHHGTYYEVKSRFDISTRLIVRAIGKVADSYKTDKTRLHTFKTHSAVVYDNSVMRFKGLDKVNLWAVGGRIDIPIVLGGYIQNRIHLPRRGQADLTYVRGVFFLNVVVDVPEAPIIDPDGVLGVDFGVTKIAVDSMGVEHTSQAIEDTRIRMRNLKKALQSRGTRSAKRHLKRLSGKEHRFRKDVNHCISKNIIMKCLRHSHAVGLEDLTGIKEVTVRKAQRDKHNSWAFRQLRSFIEYKAQVAGLPVITVDPRYTSQSCSQCGFKDKRNRKSQAEFRCLDCGYSTNADYNAALNICKRADTRQPIVAP